MVVPFSRPLLSLGAATLLLLASCAQTPVVTEPSTDLAITAAPEPLFIQFGQPITAVPLDIGTPVFADDFAVPAGESWTLSQVYYAGIGNGGTHTVRLYRDASGAPGELLHTFGDLTATLMNPEPSLFSSYQLDITPTTLTSGSYWLNITTTADVRWVVVQTPSEEATLAQGEGVAGPWKIISEGMEGLGFLFALGGDNDTPQTTYTVDFSTAPLKRILWNVRVGRGVSYEGDGSPNPSIIRVDGQRYLGGKVKGSNQVKVLDLYGSKRLTLVRQGTNTPFPNGGVIDIKPHAGFAHRLTLKSLTVSNITAPGAQLTLRGGGKFIKRLPLAQTGAGQSVTIALNEPGVSFVQVGARSAFAVDDMVFEDAGATTRPR